MLELAEKVIEMTCSSSKTVFRPLPWTTRPSANRIFGYKKKTGVEASYYAGKRACVTIVISGAFSRNKVSQPQRLLKGDLNCMPLPKAGSPEIERGHSFTGGAACQTAGYYPLLTGPERTAPLA